MAFDSAVAGFDGGTREAEIALGRLRDAMDQVSAHLRLAGALKDDLVFLSDRGESLADRLDTAVRTARPLAPTGLAASGQVGRAIPSGVGLGRRCPQPTRPPLFGARRSEAC